MQHTVWSLHCVERHSLALEKLQAKAKQELVGRELVPRAAEPVDRPWWEIMLVSAQYAQTRHTTQEGAAYWRSQGGG